MTTIKYFDGEKEIDVEVTEEFAAVYKELQREEERMSKRVERHEVASLTQMEDENGYQLGDLYAPDPLDIIVKREEQEELRANMEKTYSMLTERQKQVVELLCSGKTVSEIARLLNLNQKTIWEIREAIQKKYKKFL